MGMQFARGKKKVSEEGEVGQMDVRTELTVLKAWEWELTPEEWAVLIALSVDSIANATLFNYHDEILHLIEKTCRVT